VVEFVVVVPMLVLLVLGVVQVGLALHVRSTLASAAAEGARVAAVSGGDTAAGEVRVRAALVGSLADGVVDDVVVTRSAAGGVATLNVLVRARLPLVGFSGRPPWRCTAMRSRRSEVRRTGSAGSRTADSGTADSGTADSGTAVLEVLVLGVGLLVPLLYAVVSVMSVQSASYAATSAAREAARAYVTADTPSQAPRGRELRHGSYWGNSGVAAVTPAVRRAGTCLAPGSRVDVTVVVAVALPLLPGGLSITVTGAESMPVDRFRAAP